jgi:hypothetical protein
MKTAPHGKRLATLRTTSRRIELGAGRVSDQDRADAGHTGIQMTMRQKKIAKGKFETFRIAGILEAIGKRFGVVAFPTAVN